MMWSTMYKIYSRILQKGGHNSPSFSVYTHKASGTLFKELCLLYFVFCLYHIVWLVWWHKKNQLFVKKSFLFGSKVVSRPPHAISRVAPGVQSVISIYHGTKLTYSLNSKLRYEMDCLSLHSQCVQKNFLCFYICIARYTPLKWGN